MLFRVSVPSSPRDVTVSVLTASAVSVQWHVPDEPHGRNLSEIIYAIHWAGSNLSYRSQSNGTIWVRNPGRGQFLTEAVQGLLDSQVYQFKVMENVLTIICDVILMNHLEF